MGNESQRLVTEVWNRTARDYPCEVTIDDWIVRTMKRTPHAPAVTLEGITYSYADLDAASARIASELQALGIGEESRVGVSMVRSFELCAVLLGILRAGAAYVPIDPTLPAERIHYMIHDSGAKVLFTHRDSWGPWTDVDQWARRASPTLLVAEAVLESSASVEGAQVAGSRNPKRLACVLYTSGSTGAPKGVMIEHASISNLFFWMSETFELTEGDVFIQNTPFGFDVSLTELFLPLTVGAQVVLARPEGHKDPTYLAGVVERSGVTIVNFVPSMFRAFIEGLEGRPIRSLRAVLSMGEPLSRDLAESAALALPGVPLHNLYGLTETTVHATLWTFRQNHQPANQILVGRPLANTALYILNEVRRPVEIGEVGEIYIAGRQLARGYLNREELTSERFLANPFEPDGVMYKTGDLGRFTEDGNVEFLGRNDFQVKLRGLRIELGEIEHVLANVDGVRQSAVVLRHADNGEPLLVAYLRVSNELGGRPTVAQLHEAASRALPAYMVPSAFVVMGAFPLNQNGKLDRGKLPPPERSAFCDAQFEPPVGGLELLIASEWKRLLGPIGGTIGRNDSFVLLGGHSLLAVQFVSGMRRQGWQIALADVFEGKTLAKIAECAVRIQANSGQAELARLEHAAYSRYLVSLGQGELDAVRGVIGGRAEIQDILPLTPFQEGLLFHHRAARSGDPYLLSGVLSFASKDQLDDYVQGFQAVVNRHDALRTCIVHTCLKQPVQVVLKAVSVPLEHVTVSGATEQEVVAGLLKRYGASGNSLNLESAPLLRLYVCEWAGSWLLVEVRHHILVDDHSIVLCRREIMAWLRGEFQTLCEPALLREYAMQTTPAKFEGAALEFFRNMLGLIQTPTSPYGLDVVHGVAPRTRESAAWLPASLSARLNRVALQFGVSAATLFHLGWFLVLNRLTEQKELVFGTVLVDRRGIEESEAAVGPFMNTLPIALTVTGRVDRLVRTTQQLLASLLRHVGTRLVDAQGCACVPKGRPLFSSLLNYRFATLAELEQQVAPGVSFLGEESLATYPLAVTIEPVNNGFRLALRSDVRIDPTSVCDLFVGGMDQLIGALERRPDTLVQELDVMPPIMRQHLVKALNPPFASRQYDRVERLFESRAARTPEHLALSDGASQLTFAALNHRANQIARWLARRGVVAGDVVALILPRGIELICFQIATLKLGGVYAPLDPSHPIERLRRQIDIASAVLTIVDSEPLAEQLSVKEHAVNVAACDPSHWSGESTENASLKLSGDAANQPAYIMFTSGSTGEPKGVVVTHAGIVRLVTQSSWIRVCPGDRVTILSNPAFDGSTFEVWAALLNGATGVVIEQALLFDPPRLQERLLATGATVMLLPTALFHQYGIRLAKAYAGLTYLVVGGERLQASVVERVVREGRPRHLVNAYGPTETSVIATTYEIPEGKTDDSVPIGRPIDQTSVYLLDPHGRLVPPGAVGEIWVSGDGVALGYVNAQEASAARFGVDPFCPERGRIYRTGDLGRYRADGTIDYIGRVDTQVKVRGHRVELGEIEAAIRRLSFVTDAAVVIVSSRGDGDTRVAAFVCFGDRPSEEGVAAVRQDLERALPSFMLPAVIVAVPRLPLTPNGKVDVEMLAHLDTSALPEVATPGVSANLAERLTNLWCRALGVSVVEESDDFFELGGHSLLAMTLVEQMRQELGLNVDVPMLFEHSSPRELLRAASHSE